jgi:hypothetical protein
VWQKNHASQPLRDELHDKLWTTAQSELILADWESLGLAELKRFRPPRQDNRRALHVIVSHLNFCS